MRVICLHDIIGSFRKNSETNRFRKHNLYSILYLRNTRFKFRLRFHNKNALPIRIKYSNEFDYA